MLIGDLMTHVAASKTLNAQAALSARRALWREGGIDERDIESLLILDEVAVRRDPAWVALVVEAVTDHVVHRQPPLGSVSDGNADWLIARIAKDGMVKTQTGLELLVRVLEMAHASPERLAVLALHQVKLAVATGEEPLALQGCVKPGRVDRPQTDILRRILCANGDFAVTRTEAEILFDINDAAPGPGNDPAWSGLFVKAVANAMTATGCPIPSRRQALSCKERLCQAPEGLAGAMMADDPKVVPEASRQPGVCAERAGCDCGSGAGATGLPSMTAEAAEWLAGRLSREGPLSENERALLHALDDTCPTSTPRSVR